MTKIVYNDNERVNQGFPWKHLIDEWGCYEKIRFRERVDLFMSDRRLTNHSGRVHKSSGRVYNVDHNDRQFEHDDNSLESRNVYWQRISTDEITTFKQCEREFYKQTYGEHLRLCNERAEQSRHYKRIKTIDDYLNSAAMAPEETLFYLGDKDNQVPTEVLDEFAKDMVHYIESTFPQIKVLDYAIHRDEEGADHIHMRKTYLAIDKDGNYAPKQDMALQQMGIKRPDISKSRGKYNNTKQTYTSMERAWMKEWCLEHNIEITTEPPREPGLSGRDKQLYEYEQELAQVTNMLNMSKDALQLNKDDAVALQQRIEDKQQELADIKRENERELAKRERMGKTFLGKRKDRIEVDKDQFAMVLDYCKQSMAIEEQQQRQQQSLNDRERNLAKDKSYNQQWADSLQQQQNELNRIIDVKVRERTKQLERDKQKIAQERAIAENKVRDYEQTDSLVVKKRDYTYTDTEDRKHTITVEYTIKDIRDIATNKLSENDFIKQQQELAIDAIEQVIERKISDKLGVSDSPGIFDNL